MEKKIGIDLDMTLFKCNKSVVYFFLNKLNLNKSKKLKHKEIPPNKIYKCNILNSVVKFLNPKEYSLFFDAVKTVNYLSENGYKIYLVSNRPCIKSVVALTLESLKRCKVCFDKLILGCNNKIEFIKQENFDFFIDNVEYVCKNILQETDAEPICFKANLKDKEKRYLKKWDIQKFSTWNEIGEFFERNKEEKTANIEKLKDEKILT